MNLLLTMDEYRREASWAVWELDSFGNLTGTMSFPMDQARAAMHGRTMVVLSTLEPIESARRPRQHRTGRTSTIQLRSTTTFFSLRLLLEHRSGVRT